MVKKLIWVYGSWVRLWDWVLFGNVLENCEMGGKDELFSYVIRFFNYCEWISKSKYVFFDGEIRNI